MVVITEYVHMYVYIAYGSLADCHSKQCLQCFIIEEVFWYMWTLWEAYELAILAMFYYRRGILVYVDPLRGIWTSATFVYCFRKETQTLSIF